jgi:nitrate reductase gamma subunit
MILQRVLAVLLLLVAFVALALSHTFPFSDALPGLVQTAIAMGGAACCLAGVSLWLRRRPQRPSQAAPHDREAR